MERLELKKAVFTPDSVTIKRKKGDIVIGVDEIERLAYERPTFFKYLFSLGSPNLYLGYLEIKLKKKIGRSRSYSIRIKYKDVLRLPDFYLFQIYPQFRWDP